MSKLDMLKRELHIINMQLEQPQPCNYTWSKLQEQKLITERELSRLSRLQAKHSSKYPNSSKKFKQKLISKIPIMALCLTLLRQGLFAWIHPKFLKGACYETRHRHLR